MVKGVGNIVTKELDALAFHIQCIIQDGDSAVLNTELGQLFLHLFFCPSRNLALHHLMYCVKKVVARKADDFLQLLKLRAFLGDEGAKSIINRILVKVEISKRFSNGAMTGELYSDVPHDLFLVSIFSKKIAEQVNDFICRLLCSSSTIFLFRDIFQNPERCTGLFRTLLGHIFSGFGFVDRLVVLQMENLLHICPAGCP